MFRFLTHLSVQILYPQIAQVITDYFISDNTPPAERQINELMFRRQTASILLPHLPFQLTRL